MPNHGYCYKCKSPKVLLYNRKTNKFHCAKCSCIVKAFQHKEESRIYLEFLKPVKLLILIFFAFSLIQTSPAKDKKDKTSYIWFTVQAANLITAEADALTTSQAIRRGYVESSPIDNIFIPRNSPSPIKRSALLLGQTAGFNLILNYAFHKCGPSRACKWVCIAAGSYFAGRYSVNSFHNSRLK